MSLLRWDLAEVTPAVKWSLLPRISASGSLVIGEAAARFVDAFASLFWKVWIPALLEFKMPHSLQSAQLSHV